MVKSNTSTRMIKSNKVGNDKHNDCLYNCILQSFGYNTELMNIKKPSLLKKKLNLERDDKIELSKENLIKIEKLFDVSFSICGDVKYNSKVMKHYNVNLKVKDEHVNLLCNEGREKNLYEKKEEFIYTYCYTNDDKTIYCWRCEKPFGIVAHWDKQMGDAEFKPHLEVYITTKTTISYS